jgi:hypothetical protein
MPTILEKMPISQKLHLKISCQGAHGGQTVSTHVLRVLIIIHCLLKMRQGQTVPDPDPELINVRSLDFAKPKLFFKNIAHYAATSTYIHVRIPFNVSQILETQQTIENTHTHTTTHQTQRTFQVNCKINTHHQLDDHPSMISNTSSRHFCKQWKSHNQADQKDSSHFACPLLQWLCVLLMPTELINCTQKFQCSKQK